MSLSKECHPNGVRKTRKVLRSEANFRRASGYVAAIDFGTTNCSLTYALQGTTEILKMPLDGHHMRVPNAILIEKESNKVVAFGYRAQTQFSRLRKTDRKKYIYFERMKMILYRSPDLSRRTLISPINSNEQYYLLDVVAFILKYLKDQLYAALSKSDLDMSRVQFDWVVTVPAIWDIRGKQMMREAAYKAGLCSAPANCKLMPYSSSNKRLDRPLEDAPDRLTLALEPEVAGLWCQQRACHNKSQHFTVLDIGGGTVDITSYCIDKGGHICVVDKASGNDWGGTRVNEKFSQFIETIVKDPGFSQYVSVRDLELQHQHKADLNKLIYSEFEKQKIIFGEEENMETPIVVQIPNSFMKFYTPGKLAAGINSKYTDIVELEGNQLTIEPQKVKEFFQPSISQIFRDTFCSLERVEKGGKKLEAVYLVGGFGGCNFVKKVVQDRLQGRYDPELKVFVPIDHKMAVACGAIVFRRNPKIIWSRKAEATYGTIVQSQFKADIHDPAYKVVKEDGNTYCTNLFQPFIEIGDTICANELLQKTFIPTKDMDTEIQVIVYSSNKREIWYAKDKDNKLASGLQEVGTLVFDMKGIPGKNRHEKRVVLTIDLSQAEIQLKAHDEKERRKEVKVVLDTLL